MRNLPLLTETEKKLVVIVIQDDGYVRINYTGKRILIVAPNSNFHKAFNKFFFGKFLQPAGPVIAGRGYGLNLDKLKMPFNVYMAYRVISTLNRDDYFFDELTARVDTYFRLGKQVYT